MALATAVALSRACGSAGHVELQLANPAGVHLVLYRAGRTLDEAQPVALDGEATWIEPGSYFVEARTDALRWFYPVPLATFRRGPEPSGA